MKKYLYLNLVCLAVVMVCAGCDQFKAVQEYFHKTEPKKITAPAEKAPVVTQAVEKKIESAPIATTPMPGNVLARVGNWSMTAEEFAKRLENLKKAAPNYDLSTAENKKAVLDELINQQIIVTEAEKKGLMNNKDVQEALEEAKRMVLAQVFVKDLVENVKVSDEEAKALYDERKELFTEPIQLHVREMVMDSQEKANAVLVEILKGADFGEMAKQNSKGKTAAQGGDLGFISNVPFPEMGNILMALDVGSTSNVFKGPDGFYIVKVEAKKGGEQLPFEKVKEDIIQNLVASKQQQAVLDYVSKLRQQVKVEINQDLLKSKP
ncbi:MAG: peptidyl-prolyl cis-trans isomerase [Candidatus Omnitrophica bacterium]|nr:peptidyl-prolyl cis-trans isomerase [Candidatus Omnitrophota bacterium]